MDDIALAIMQAAIVDAYERGLKDANATQPTRKPRKVSKDDKR